MFYIKVNNKKEYDSVIHKITDLKISTPFLIDKSIETFSYIYIYLSMSKKIWYYPVNITKSSEPIITTKDFLSKSLEFILFEVLL